MDWTIPGSIIAFRSLSTDTSFRMRRTRSQPYHDAYAGAQEQYKRDKAEWDAEQQRTASLQSSSSS